MTVMVVAAVAEEEAAAAAEEAVEAAAEAAETVTVTTEKAGRGVTETMVPLWLLVSNHCGAASASLQHQDNDTFLPKLYPWLHSAGSE